MILFKTILYAPEQEGGSGPISSSEIFGQELASEELVVPPSEDLDAILEGIEISSEEEPAILEDALDSAERAIKSPELSFPISEETGLSYQWGTINELKEQLQALESRTDTNLEGEIIEARNEAYTQAEQALTSAQTDLDDALHRINARLNTLKANDSKIKLTIEEFIDSTPALKNIVENKEEALKVSKQTLAEFESETQILINEAYEIAIQEIQERLAPLQDEYQDSEAEQYDKKVLLEQKLDSLLTNPEQLFSDANISEILAIYGFQEGQERLQQLQEQSKEAQEQYKKDTIKEEILKNLYWSKDKIPELTQAIDVDIEAKLKQLQEQYPDLDTITKALKLSGKDRFAYLLDSAEPELEQLAFWSTTYRSENQENILAEHPQLSQYVEKQVAREFKEQEEAKDNLTLQREKQSQDRMKSSIENGVKKYAQQEVQDLKRTVQQIQNGELAESLRQDEGILESKKVLNTRKIDTFKQELTSALESGITFEDGEFRNTFDAPTLNAEINKKIQTITQELQGYLEGLEGKDYKINSLDDLSQLSQMIQTDLAAENKKFLKNQRKISAIQGAQKVITENSEQYQRLQAQKEQNTSQWQLKMQQSKGLNTKYNESLPHYIRDKLKTVSIDSMSSNIDLAVQELQQYETPAELQAQRDKIAQLQQQIEELQRVT